MFLKILLGIAFLAVLRILFRKKKKTPQQQQQQPVKGKSSTTRRVKTHPGIKAFSGGLIAPEVPQDELFAMLPTDEKLMFRDEVPNGFRLEIEKGQPTGRNILLIGTRIVIGRSPSCDVVVDDPTISEKHLELTIHPGKPITLSDLNSTNGTFLNGKRVKQSALKDEALIQIGHTHLRFKRNQE